MSQHVVLTIAGTDPSGGAGIQADLKTFTALKCYGTSVITALTAQNTTGVQGVHACPPEFVEQQISSVLSDIPIHAIKTGMLVDARTIDAVVGKLKEHYSNATRPALVVDPVMISTSGHTLLESSAVNILRDKLLPLATIVTPNIPEAELLLAASNKITSVEMMKDAARRLSAQYNVPHVLLKGGHLHMTYEELSTEDGIEWADVCSPSYPQILRAVDDVAFRKTISRGLVVDVLYSAPSGSDASAERFTLFSRPRIDTKSTHGTGCTLSAALACELAQGRSVLEATRNATAYTHLGISTATVIGSGHGPLNHMHPIVSRAIPLPTPDEPFPVVSALVRASQSTWNDYVQHPFVVQLGRGTLSRDSFIHFIKQDYHYLKHYARAHGLLATKSSDLASIAISAQIMLYIAQETNTHEAFCASFGITAAELEATPESPATTAYGLYVLDVGLRGDATALVFALAACLLGYGEVGLWLKKETQREGSGMFLEGNPYERWIEDYSGAMYQKACREGIQQIEARMAENPPTREEFRKLGDIWERCVRLEKGFWDMAVALS